MDDVEPEEQGDAEATLLDGEPLQPVDLGGIGDDRLDSSDVAPPALTKPSTIFGIPAIAASIEPGSASAPAPPNEPK